MVAVPKHPSKYMYEKKKCRCEDCISLMRTWWKQWEKIRPPRKYKYYKDKNKSYEERKPTLDKKRELIRSLKAVPCKDCGGNYPFYVMQFDHIDATNKEFTISKGLYNVSLENLLTEISKCEVVCANCHAIRTYLRGQYPKPASKDSGAVLTAS